MATRHPIEHSNTVASGVPRAVRWAGILLASYGVVITAGHLLSWATADVEMRALARGMSQGLFSIFLAVQLFRLRRMAWWMAMAVVGFWIAAPVLVLVLAQLVRPEFTVPLIRATPQYLPILLLWWSVVLGLLLLPSSREAFRAQK